MESHRFFKVWLALAPKIAEGETIYIGEIILAISSSPNHQPMKRVLVIPLSPAYTAQN